MKDAPYTPNSMDAARGATESRDSRFDELYAEAKSTLGYGANSLRSVTERYREAYHDTLGRWHNLRDQGEAVERSPVIPTDKTDPAAAAEAGAEDARQKALRAEVERLTSDLGRHQQELSKLELSVRSMENAWLFLERGDASLLAEVADSGFATDLQMRIVEAQEAERARLAQEVHDGPAQALSNAIFQVEFIERIFDSDARMARQELRFLRELLRRELGDVRSFIGHLRPTVLVELGLDGSIMDTVTTQAALSGMRISADLAAPAATLPEPAQTVVLRVVQEALQNIRKHAAATNAVVATMMEEGEWVLEVRDAGRGFDTGAVAARGRHNYGLQFMRERAELI